jgi:SNF2 family DNA or RNA helicase
VICLDEAQFIKNPHAETSKSVKQLSGELRLCLTGTPLENVSTDLWSIMDFLNPGLLGTLREFSNRFPKRGSRDSETTATRFRRLRRIVAPFLLRRTKEAVAPELPAKTETVLTCVMGTRQARFYETLRAHHQQEVQAAIESRDQARIGSAIFTGLLRLRQAALYPADAASTEQEIPAVKEKELVAQLTEIAAEGHNALVFSQFVSALKRLRSATVAAGVNTLYLDGGTRGRERLISQFQETTEPTAFFISLKAGGTGINLTAADYVFICDPWWNPQVERQAVDRAHRIGRYRPVMVTRLVTAGTVEDKVLRLQEQKRRLAADLIAENESGLSAASAEELLALFE